MILNNAVYPKIGGRASTGISYPIGNGCGSTMKLTNVIIIVLDNIPKTKDAPKDLESVIFNPDLFAIFAPNNIPPIVLITAIKL